MKIEKSKRPRTRNAHKMSVAKNKRASYGDAIDARKGAIVRQLCEGKLTPVRMESHADKKALARLLDAHGYKIVAHSTKDTVWLQFSQAQVSHYKRLAQRARTK